MERLALSSFDTVDLAIAPPPSSADPVVPERLTPATVAEFVRLADEWSAWDGPSAPAALNEGLRLQALDAYDVLGTPPEEAFDRITRLTAQILRVPNAMVSLIGKDVQWHKSCFGFSGVRETSRKVAFCAHTILQHGPMIVSDATLDPRFANNPLVTGWPYIRFYLGVPLTTTDGLNLGSLCAIDSKPREPAEEDVQTLQALAALVVDELELRKALRESAAKQAALAQTEERYRHLAESIEGMVFHAVQRGPQHFEYEYVSKGSLPLFGLLPEQLLSDRFALRRLLHPDDMESGYRAIEESLRTGAPYCWEGRFVLASGEEKWIRASARGEAAPDGATHWRGMFVDDTKVRERERALAEAKEHAERATRAKGEFLSRMSHELRTPLNGILGFAQTLAMEPLGAEAREDVAEIDKAGRHLLGLINEVLDLASTESDGLRRVKESISVATAVPVCEVLQEVYGLLRPLIEDRDLRLRAVHLCGNAHVLADRTHLKQALINVTTNAIKYNRPGGSVRVRTGAESGGWVTIAVSDEGPGIAPDCLARLFTPFDRLDVEKSGVEGTGLGLAITLGFVESMGGSIDVQSVLGQGSTFTIRLPRAEVTSE